MHLGENPHELMVKACGIGHAHLLGQIFDFEEDPPPTFSLSLLSNW
jgi:hypothetical protein